MLFRGFKASGSEARFSPPNPAVGDRVRHYSASHLPNLDEHELLLVEEEDVHHAKWSRLCQWTGPPP